MRLAWVGKWFPLVLISGLSLFLELAVIRWLSVEVRLFAYFKSLPLLAAFLGLAIGFALVNKGQDYSKSFAPLFFIFTALVLAVGKVSGRRLLAYPSRGEEFLWAAAPLSDWAALVLFLGTVAVFFLFTVLLFIPLGQATGEEMALHKPVPAYIVNIAASLLGIWIFSLLSFLQTSPPVWFGLGLIGMAYYAFWRKSLRRQDIFLYALSALGILFYSSGVIWSPYNRLSLSNVEFLRKSDGERVLAGYTLNVQQVYFQRAIDLSDTFLERYGEEIPDILKLADAYDLPFQLVHPGGKALVVGAGMGNDVAAALRSGVGEIDAVEIDPTILRLGLEKHPESPYSDARVHLITDDARSFFVRNKKQYDIVAFGLLDSHTLLSSMSSVRLDSYVYTLESLQQVKNHLTEVGVVSLSFAEDTPWIEERLGRMMEQVFGVDNVYQNKNVNGSTFVAGALTRDQALEAGLARWTSNASLTNLPLPTDDWPYLYMRSRKVPDAYWQMLLVVGVLSLLVMRRSFPQTLRPDWHFVLLGGGFMLIEFTSITRLALLFGSTWLVNALAISGVLLMILGANLLVLWRTRISTRLVYGLLFISLPLVYFFPLDSLNQLAALPRSLISIVILSLPLFFSGMIFSESLRRMGETARPLASNLTGSVLGGVLEYTSIWWGVQSLYITGSILYLLAFAAFLIARNAEGKN